MDGYVMTIDSDTEEGPSGGKVKVQDTDDTQLNPEFSFDFASDFYTDALGPEGGLHDLVKKGSKMEPVSVEDIIARRKLSFHALKRKYTEDPTSDFESDSQSKGSFGDVLYDGQVGTTEDGASVSQEHNFEPDESNDSLATDEDSHVLGEEEGGKDTDDTNDEIASASSDDDSDLETQAERDRKTAFFDSESMPSETHSSFLSMNLSRPIVKALTGLNFSKPTPIQAATIPVALLGKDVVGNAVTGSGKTAAFIIPMLERLLYRDRGKKAAATRCLILVPTRELGVQCFEVGSKLATHTDVRLALVVGGLSIKAQEATLRSRPDIVIATPGRLIDHIRNSPSFTLDALDVLVLDEADRMLSDGFADELTEIIKSCPVSRQTMLFSATMTDSVDQLVKVSLDKPVRLFVDPKKSTARGLVQEFVRVRAGKEAERSALLATLCKRTFKTGVIVFLRSKKLAHQLRIVFSLLDMKCEELHGDLSQEQRLKALQLFRDGSVDFLLATDLASRGLDIKGIDTVINYDMPGQLAQYLHRVGRTARAGKTGRSVTLVGEADRKMLKSVIKHSADEDQVRHRIIPQEAVAKWAAKLDELKDEIVNILQEEKEERELRKAEMEVRKGENLIEHEAEISSRPARTWFQSNKEKDKAKAMSRQQYEAGFKENDTPTKPVIDKSKPKRDKFAGLSRRAKRRKLAVEEDADTLGGMSSAIRAAKKAARPGKIGVPESRSTPTSSEAKSKKSRRTVTTSAGGAFSSDLGQQPQRTEGIRSRKTDAVGGMKVKKGGKHKRR